MAPLTARPGADQKQYLQNEREYRVLDSDGVIVKVRHDCHHESFESRKNI